MQFLQPAEFELLKCLKENYNAIDLYFSDSLGKWIIISKNKDGLFIRGTFDECTFTLNRITSHNIETLVENYITSNVKDTSEECKKCGEYKIDFFRRPV